MARSVPKHINGRQRKNHSNRCIYSIFIVSYICRWMYCRRVWVKCVYEWMCWECGVNAYNEFWICVLTLAQPENKVKTHFASIRLLIPSNSKYHHGPGYRKLRINVSHWLSFQRRWVCVCHECVLCMPFHRVYCMCEKHNWNNIKLLTAPRVMACISPPKNTQKRNWERLKAARRTFYVNTTSC